MKDKLRAALQRSFDRLLREDGRLFDCEIEEHDRDNARKLHEVCINHRLAIYFQEEVVPSITAGEKLFVDIEFNKEGANPKEVIIDGKKRPVRPDIIIHNRETGDDKRNVLVIECKKEGTSKKKICEDRKKILALMNNERYNYTFGLLVIYAKNRIRGTLFFKNGKNIATELIDQTVA
ncbi:MAG: hypothetical protein E4G91_06805 [Candidatus Zixiibacteriota bacterium]|nr:MAG: hypothetical protein E4G91_06805 [candidate division Zixibacteria bacterium]